MKKHNLIEGLYRVFKWSSSLSRTPDEYRPPKGWMAIPTVFEVHPITNKPLYGGEVWIVEIRRGK
jgi:hypothetical protein